MRKLIAGDFNAHLGTLAGVRGVATPNNRGIFLKEFIDQNNLLLSLIACRQVVQTTHFTVAITIQQLTRVYISITI